METAAAVSTGVAGEEAHDPTLRRNKAPNKAFYRQRAHCNPLAHNNAFDYPVSPEAFDLRPIYPAIENPVISFLDVGCGFGGLTMELARLYPDKLVLGMEIRAKLTEYVRKRIEAARVNYPGQYQNAGVWRTNSMKYLPNYIPKGTIEKIFICFPDPHFKGKKKRRRIVSDALLSEYAYVLAPGALLYTITDVKELHEWHVAKCDAHPYFQRIPDEEIMASDPGAQAMVNVTEEGKKVTRNHGSKYYAVYRRIADDELPTPALARLAESMA